MDHNVRSLVEVRPARRPLSFSGPAAFAHADPDIFPGSDRPPRRRRPRPL